MAHFFKKTITSILDDDYPVTYWHKMLLIIWLENQFRSALLIQSKSLVETNVFVC